MPESQRKKQILVLRYRFIGDTILTVPFLRNLRRAEPEAHIAWMVAPGSSEVVSGVPYVDELIFWDPVTIHADSRGAHRTWREKLRFIREIRSRRFDKVYILKRSFSSALMGFFSGAPERVGFNTEGRGLLLTKRVPYRPDQHEVLSFLSVLSADDIPVHDDYLESWVSGQERQEAERLLAEAGIDDARQLLAIHPFGSIFEKTWPLERFAAVAGQLADQCGFVPVILGAKGDRTWFEKGRHHFPAGSCDLVGRCNIRITQAILRRSAFFLGNDSGVMHLAAAAGLPLLAIFGPTSPTRFGPWGARAQVMYSSFPCSPCRQKYFTECEPAAQGKPACIDTITVAAVLEQCQRILTEGGTV